MNPGQDENTEQQFDGRNFLFASWFRGCSWHLSWGQNGDLGNKTWDKWEDLSTYTLLADVLSFWFVGELGTEMYELYEF